MESKNLVDLDRADELMRTMAAVVDHPLGESSPRVELSAQLAEVSLQLAAAVRSLCAISLALGASVTLRSQFEALVRSVWALHGATDDQVGRLSAFLSQESQQGSKNMPTVNGMLQKLEEIPELANLMIALNEFKTSSWLPLNSFVHSGIHAIHWAKYGTPPEQLETIFRTSNALSILAFQEIGILTGRPKVQAELMASTLPYAGILPKHRNSS
jgi:hypothetical protein